MVPHKTSTEIRLDIISRLSADAGVLALIPDATHIHDSRLEPFDKDDLPAINVTSGDYTDDTKSLASLVFKRMEDVNIQTEVWAATDAALAAAADAIKDACDHCLFADTVWVKQFEGVENKKCVSGGDYKSDEKRGGNILSFQVRQSIQYQPHAGHSFKHLHVRTHLERPVDPETSGQAGFDTNLEGG